MCKRVVNHTPVLRCPVLKHGMMLLLFPIVIWISMKQPTKPNISCSIDILYWSSTLKYYHSTHGSEPMTFWRNVWHSFSWKICLVWISGDRKKRKHSLKNSLSFELVALLGVFEAELRLNARRQVNLCAYIKLACLSIKLDGPKLFLNSCYDEPLRAGLQNKMCWEYWNKKLVA